MNETRRDENIPPGTGLQGRDDTGEVVVGLILFLAFVLFLYFANGGT